MAWPAENYFIHIEPIKVVLCTPSWSTEWCRMNLITFFVWNFLHALYFNCMAIHMTYFILWA
jgi:hypothetical protein